MLAKTHLAITIFFIFLLLPFVQNQFIFIFFSILATFLPDVDSKFSAVGKNKGLRIVQIFLKHRGILHSFIFLFLITLFLILFFPVFSLPFFLGYGLHLIADSFTVSGVKLFYPFKKNYSGFVKTGTRRETFILIVFLVLDLGLLYELF